MILNISCLLQSFLIAFYQINLKEYYKAYFIVAYMNNLTAITMIILTDGVLVSGEIHSSRRKWLY